MADPAIVRGPAANRRQTPRPCGRTCRGQRKAMAMWWPVTQACTRGLCSQPIPCKTPQLWPPGFAAGSRGLQLRKQEHQLRRHWLQCRRRGAEKQARAELANA